MSRTPEKVDRLFALLRSRLLANPDSTLGELLMGDVDFDPEDLMRLEDDAWIGLMEEEVKGGTDPALVPERRIP